MGLLYEDVRHGEYAGAQWHQRNNVPMCDPCRDASNRYQHEFREGKVGTAGPSYKERNALGNKARYAALHALKSNHATEYAQLLATEKQKRGI